MSISLAHLTFRVAVVTNFLSFLALVLGSMFAFCRWDSLVCLTCLLCFIFVGFLVDVVVADPTGVGYGGLRHSYSWACYKVSSPAQGRGLCC